MKSIYKSYLLILFSIILPLILFYGSVDDFGPRHMENINDISQNGFLTKSDRDSIPGYYSYGSIIAQICNINSSDLLFFPVQLIPFTFVFFLFIYSLSKNYILAGVITLIELMTGTTGTPKVFFWPHGLGYILFFSLVFISFKFIENRNIKVSEYTLLYIILGSSLVFVSYDLFAMLALFSASLALITLVVSFAQQRNYLEHTLDFMRFSKKFIRLFLILIVIELGFSKFVYSTFVKIIVNTTYIEISSFDKFFSHFFGSSSETQLDTLLLHYPSIISVIYSFKYFLLIISILICTFFLFKRILTKREINPFDCILLSFFFMSALYAIIRLYIGQIVITYFYLPGILSILWIYRFSNSCKKISIFFIILILLIAPFSYIILYENNLLNSDASHFSNIKNPSNWYDRKGVLVTSSDELTYGLFKMFIAENDVYINNNKFANQEAKTMLIMTPSEVLYLLNQSNSDSLNRCFIVNYDLNSMNLQNWIVIGTWRSHRSAIENNKNLDKIYDIRSLSIYVS